MSNYLISLTLFIFLPYKMEIICLAHYKHSTSIRFLLFSSVRDEYHKKCLTFQVHYNKKITVKVSK